MRECSKFVCVAADKINFLIPSNQIVKSVYCNGSDYFWDDKFIFENNTIPFVDFYNDNTNIEYFGDASYTETALIIKNKELFDDERYFALVTSKECTVLEIEYRQFSLFSKKFEDDFKKKGFIACYFQKNKIFYLIDIEVFLQNFKL